MGALPAAISASSAALCAVALLAFRAAPVHVAAALALSFLPYGLLLRLPLDPARRPLRLALAGAALAGAIMVLAPSPLSDDVYRYLWDGRMWLAGRDAYALPPSDPALGALRDAAWSRINHRTIPTIYPPLAEACFALCALLWPSIHALKLLALGCHLTTALCVRALARGAHDATTSTTISATAAERAAVLWVLNPLMLGEAALGGHIDAAAGLAVAGFALALQRGRARIATALAVAASGLKLLGLLLWPLLLHPRTSRPLPARAALAATALVLSVACVLPPLHAGHGRSDTASGLAHYTQRWRGNEGPFRALELLAGPLLPWLGHDAQGGNYPAFGTGDLRLRWLATFLPDAQPGVFDIDRKERPAPGTIPREQLRFMLARSLSALLVGGVLLLSLRRRITPLATARAVCWTVLLTAPQVHPWYLLWLLPLDLALGRRAGVLWSATTLLAYAPLAAWQTQRVWAEPTWSYVLVYGPVLIALWIEQVREAKAKPHVGLR